MELAMLEFHQLQRGVSHLLEIRSRVVRRNRDQIQIKAAEDIQLHTMKMKLVWLPPASLQMAEVWILETCPRNAPSAKARPMQAH